MAADSSDSGNVFVAGVEYLDDDSTQWVYRQHSVRYRGRVIADETEAIRQDLAARMNIANLARREAERDQEKAEAEGGNRDAEEDEIESAPDGLNLINMVKKFINVRELDIDLIDGINPFREGFDVASKALDTPLLKQIQSAMVAQRIQMTEDEARTLWPRIKRFREAEGREPNPHAADPLEKRMAEALAYIRSKKAERLRSAAAE